MWELIWMSKLQVCVSFKNTQEEQDLYMYVISQRDKSIFIKDLIRQSINGRPSIDIPEFTPPKPKEEQKKISHGKKTRNKFLA